MAHSTSMSFYFLDVTNRIPRTQAETVLTTPDDALIGIPRTLNAVPIVEIPLMTPTTKLAPVDACRTEGKNQALVGAIPYCGETLALGLKINFDQPIK